MKTINCEANGSGKRGHRRRSLAASLCALVPASASPLGHCSAYGPGSAQAPTQAAAKASEQGSAQAFEQADARAPTQGSAQASAQIPSQASAQTAAQPSAPPSTPPSEPASARAPASAPSTQQEMHAGHSFSDTERFIRMFEDPARAEWQKPAEVVAALHVAAGSAVADLGAGSGYFTIPFARAVGPKGKVYAIDIEPGMIERIRQRARKERAEAVEAILAAPDDAGLPAASTDLVFICDTWHHIGGRVAYLRRLAHALRPGARVAIVDFDKRPLPVGPPPEEKLSRDEVVNEFREAGFVLLEEQGFLPYQYFLVFGLATARP